MKIEGQLPISVRGRDVGTLHFNVIAYCQIKEETINQWRQQTFMALKAAYRERVQEYNDYMAQKCAEQAQPPVENTDYRINPMMARAIEKRELKRLVLEFITRNTLIATIPEIGQNFYWVNGNNGQYNVIRSQDFEHYAAHAKFLEEAFDWEIMAYTLYPYYWAERNGWGELIRSTSDADFIFQAFLQAGLSKMVVPVRAGYEKAVMFYLDTGIIVDSSAIVTDGEDGLYQSIDAALDMTEYDDEGNPVDPKPEAVWETRIPSSLVIIQKDSNPLDRDGLPCDCKEEEDVIGGTKGEGSNLLGVVEASDIG